MDSVSSNKKEAKMLSVAQATLQLLGQGGVDAVSFSRIARSSGVSRAWLYKYIGNSDEKLIEFSVDLFGSYFARLDEPVGGGSSRLWTRQVIDRFSALLETSLKYPVVLNIYFRYQATPTLLGQRIARIESVYLKHQVLEIQKSVPVSAAQARMVAEILLGIRMGLAHRWLSAEFRKSTSKEELLQYLKRSLRSLLRSKKTVT